MHKRYSVNEDNRSALCFSKSNNNIVIVYYFVLEQLGGWTSCNDIEEPSKCDTADMSSLLVTIYPDAMGRSL